ncbi:uncharacterized protein [Leptinotarsa decemlineata]|uniref:uncharacterized protein n=1 Tax=Leptinotarsa decemlineata TaxID=7539 RepID=UPI003D307608
MSGNKCGLSTRNDHSLSFFRFPVKDPTRCKQWIIHSGNITLPGLSPKSLSNKFLCSRHFDPRFLQHKRLPGSLDEDENIFNTVEDSSLQTTEGEEESSNSSKASEASNAPADTIDDFSATVESCWLLSKKNV